MNIFKSKKGVEAISNLPFWMIFIIAVGITSIIIVSIGNFFVSASSAIPQNIEDEIILASRFYNSENCFAYKDDNGIVYGGVLDLGKFDSGKIDKCFPESNVNYAFLLLLNIPENKIIGPVYTSNWLEDSFAAKKIVEDVFVVYGENHGKKLYKGKLEISIQNVQ